MLVKPALAPKFSFRDFRSNMGRRLLMATARVDGVPVRTRAFCGCPQLPFPPAHGCGDSGWQLTIGTVHLESLNSSRYRIEQMGVTFSALSKSSNRILTGDFNFSDGWPGKCRDARRRFVSRRRRRFHAGSGCLAGPATTAEQDHIPAEYADLWPALRKAGEPGYTMVRWPAR